MAILLILIMMVKPLWPIAEYIINYDYIATNLCENKNRPQLQCDGKCYLTKMLAEEARNNHKNPFGELQMLEIPLLLPIGITSSFINFEIRAHHKQNIIGFSQNLHALLLVFKIIHPPELS